MRRRGSSYREIREVLGIPKSTLSGWFRELLLTEEEKEALATNLEPNRDRGRARAHATIRARNRAVRIDTVGHAAAEIAEITNRELLVAGVVVYWAEGSKSKPWRPNNRVIFINSDPDMLRLFLSFLDLVGVSKDDISFRLAIHESAEVTRAMEFWSDVVGVASTTFRRPTIKRHNPESHRKNTGSEYHGCLVVSVAKSSDLYWRIEGWFKAISSNLFQSAKGKIRL